MTKKQKAKELKDKDLDKVQGSGTLTITGTTIDGNTAGSAIPTDSDLLKPKSKFSR